MSDEANRSEPMSDMYTSDGPESLNKKDEFVCGNCDFIYDHVVWSEGDAFCPECGSMGTVYAKEPIKL